jgi:hypothetical protein
LRIGEEVERWRAWEEDEGRRCCCCCWERGGSLWEDFPSSSSSSSSTAQEEEEPALLAAAVRWSVRRSKCTCFSSPEVEPDESFRGRPWEERWLRCEAWLARRVRSSSPLLLLRCRVEEGPRSAG